MYHGLTEVSKRLLMQGLEDDGLAWDWTTYGTLGKAGAKKKISARIVAKSTGVWAGDPVTDALRLISAELGGAISVHSEVEDGDALKEGKTVQVWSGPAAMVLALERPFLNLTSYVGGIATHTRALVSAVEKSFRAGVKRAPAGLNPPRVTPTRKTLPGYRDLAVHGVVCGGGFSHRVSLSGGVLIKENHIAAAGGIPKAVAGARASAPHGLKIEVEVRDLAELKLAVEAGADSVLLDNFSPKEVTTALTWLDKTDRELVVECSGGITESTIGQYAQPGVHVISSGSLTLSVKAIDLSLLVD